MVDITLLELHLDDGSVQVGPATLARGDDTETAEADDGGSVAEGSNGRRAKLLLVAVALVLLAVALSLLGGDDAVEDLADLADADDSADTDDPADD